METATLAHAACDLKFKGSGAMTFEGYAAVFNNVDAYGHRIAPGAFKSTLGARERPVRLRWNHFGPVIGKFTSIEEDKHGLRVAAELTPGHSVAMDVAALLKHGAVDGLSIGYWRKASKEKDGIDVLTDLELIEISVVEEPANVQALIDDVKSMIWGAESFKDYEAILREAGGFSRADATAVVAGIKALSHGERAAKDVTTDLNAKIGEAKARAAFASLNAILEKSHG